jgi:phage/plasmid primase-like uncharacterized protein
MSDFVSFARSLGIRIDALPPLGRWARYPTEDKPRSRNGAVKYLGDVGFAQNHATMVEVAVWRPDRPLDPAAQARIRRETAAIRREEARRRARAMRGMREAFASFKPLVGGHPYLEAKGLTMQGCTGLRTHGDLLVVPAFRDGDLVSFQTITPEGEKLYRKDCPMQGAFFALERRGAAVTCLAEGLATGLAIFQSVPLARVLVCFDLGNMIAVAGSLKTSGLVVVCGDNDHATYRRMQERKALDPSAPEPRNPGIEDGKRAADAIGCGLAYPEGIEGSDWADALKEWGIDKGPARVRIEIMRHARFVEAKRTG